MDESTGLCVPNSAITEQYGKNYIMKIVEHNKKNIIKTIEVKIITKNKNISQIKSNELEENDLIIESGQYGLYDGQEIKI
mgnify:CR=1 FL=1